MEDLYMEFILFIYLICFINILFYIYYHVCHDDDDDDGKSPEYGKPHRSLTLFLLFLSKVAISSILRL